MPSDDGIVVRLPDTAEEPPGAELVAFDPEEIAQLVEESVGTSALFAARFRECAARSLLLPRRDPRRRQPLWQQRQRSAQLLDVAREFADFPVTLEAARECLQDVFDVPGLVGLMREIAGRKVRLVEVETPRPSPFARSLLFGYVGAFLYEGDAPLAERRAAALALDSTLLGELLGRVDLRELLDPDGGRRDRDAAAVADHAAPPARRRGRRRAAAPARRPVRRPSWPARGVDPAWLAELEAARRAIRIRVAGEERWIGVEDAGRYRDALGVALPVGVPEAYLEPVADPLGDLVARYARTHGPFAAATCAARFGLGVFVVEQALKRLSATGRVVSGEFSPGGAGTEWCDAEVLRHAAPPVAGRAAPRDRAGAAAGAGRVPAPLAPDRRQRPRRRRARRRDRAAAGHRGAGLGLGAAGPAGPGRRLRPAPARRAVRRRRGAVGRLRVDRRRRRLGDPRLRRQRAAAAAPARRRARARPRCTRRCSTRSATGRRCSSASCPTGSAPPTTPPWRPRSGTWSGPAT